MRFDDLYLWYLGDPAIPRYVGEMKLVSAGKGVSLRYGQEWLTIFKTSDNNLIYWNNRPKDADEGATLTIKKTTVKKEITTKAGDPAIVITRPSFKK